MPCYSHVHRFTGYHSYALCHPLHIQALVRLMSSLTAIGPPATGHLRHMRTALLSFTILIQGKTYQFIFPLNGDYMLPDGQFFFPVVLGEIRCPHICIITEKIESQKGKLSSHLFSSHIPHRCVHPVGFSSRKKTWSLHSDCTLPSPLGSGFRFPPHRFVIFPQK